MSIIIPVHNGGDAFKACLQSLSRYLPETSVIRTEVIVVADGCMDESVQLAEQFGATVLEIQAGGGPSKARNIGARHTQGDILFCIDADVMFHPEKVSQVFQFFQQNPAIDTVIRSYGDAPGSLNVLSHYKKLLNHYTHQIANEEASTFLEICGAIRKQAFWAVGGFNKQRRFMEDIDIGYRLKDQGFTFFLCKTLQAKHLKLWEGLSLLYAEIFGRGLPWTELLLNLRQAPNDLNLKVSAHLSVVLVFAAVCGVAVSIWWNAGLAVAAIALLWLITLNLWIYQFSTKNEGYGLPSEPCPGTGSTVFTVV